MVGPPAGSAPASARHATTRHATLGGTTSLVHLGDDRVADRLEVLLHGVELLLLCVLGSLEPLHDLAYLVLDLLKLILGDSRLELVLGDGVLHLVAVRLKGVLGVDALLGLGVLLRELLGLGDHAVDVLLRETALVVSDGNVGLLATSTLVLGGDVEHTVGVNVEGHLDLRDTTRGRGDSSELELAEHVVVLGAGPFTLVDLDQHTGLVVGVGGEGLRLLGWHSSVTRDKSSHDTASGLETEGQRGDVEEEEVGLASGATGEHTSLDSSTIGDSLVRVDGAARLLAVEERGDKLVDLRHAGGPTNHDNLVHRPLVNLGVAEDLLDRLEGATEEVGAEVLEASTGDAGVEVDTLEERVNLNASVGGGGEVPLGTLTGGTKTTHGAGVAGHVLLVLALELLGEVVHEAVVEVLPAKVGVTSGGLDLEDTVVNGEEGDIE